MKKYKYDIAISVAEEDLPIANLIAGELAKRSIEYYLYTENLADNWGKHILNISLDAYGSEAKYILMLTSKVFVQKYWAGIENQISQVFTSGPNAYILQLRLDDTPVDGLSRYRVFVDWNNNPAEIADILKEKLQRKNNDLRMQGSNSGKKRVLLWSRWILIISILLGCTIFIIYKATIPGTKEYAGNGVLKDSLQPIIKPVGYDTGKEQKATGPERHVTQVSHINRKGPATDKSTTQKPLEYNNKASGGDTAKGVLQFDYYISVTGNNPDLNNMLITGINSCILAKKFTVTNNPEAAKKIIKINLQESTTSSEEYKDILSSSCNYQLNINELSGAVLNSSSGRVAKPGFNRQDNLNNLAGQIVHKINSLL